MLWWVSWRFGRSNGCQAPSSAEGHKGLEFEDRVGKPKDGTRSQVSRMAVVEDRRKVTMRLTALQYGVIVIFSMLAVSFWVLQVVQHAKFDEMAENNHQRTLALRAPRGLVFDRDGRVLVENRHSYSISIVREHTKDINRTVRLLASVIGVDENRVRDIVDHHRREPVYRPITIVQDASLSQVAAVMARRLDFELPDVVVEEVPTRRYPETMAAHLFG